MAIFSRVKTWVSNEVLTASDLNAEFDNLLTNTKPSSIEDYSTNTSEMQSSADPGGVGSESLATSLAGEIQRLRYKVKQIIGGAQWYSTPDFDLTGTLGTSNIADSAITSAKIADGTIATGDIADGAITEAKIGSNAVTSAKIATDAVGSSQIAAGAVGSSELASSAVTAAKVADGSSFVVSSGTRSTDGTIISVTSTTNGVRDQIHMISGWVDGDNAAGWYGYIRIAGNTSGLYKDVYLSTQAVTGFRTGSFSIAINDSNLTNKTITVSITTVGGTLVNVFANMVTMPRGAP